MCGNRLSAGLQSNAIDANDILSLRRLKNGEECCKRSNSRHRRCGISDLDSEFGGNYEAVSQAPYRDIRLSRRNRVGEFPELKRPEVACCASQWGSC